MSTNSVLDLIEETERELNDGLDFHANDASSVGSVNFNAANICRLPRDVRASIYTLQNNILQSPNNLYRARELLVNLIKQKVEELHPTGSNTSLHVSYSSTLVANFLAMAMHLFLGRRPVVLALEGEHEGAKSPFAQFCDLTIFNSFSEMSQYVASDNQVDGFLISTFRYTDGSKNQIEEVWKLRNKHSPDAFIIADLAQNFSVHPIAFEHFDIGFASAHKWLAGAMGHGFVWISDEWAEKLVEHKLSGSMAEDNDLGLAGGGDFVGLVETYIALKLRLTMRLGYNEQFGTILSNHPLGSVCSVSPENPAFYFIDVSKLSDAYTVYSQILKQGVDIKYIKSDHSKYRLSVPYTVSESEIKYGISVLETALEL